MKPVNHLSEAEFAELVTRALALPDAPAAAVRAAMDLFQPAPVVRPSDVVEALWRKVTAVLAFDSWTMAEPALGLRAGASDTRHLLFSAGGRDIDVRIVPATNGYTLAGQVLGPDDQGVIELSPHSGAGAEDGEPRSVALDFLGEFRLDGVRRGRYQLTLRTGREEIVVSPIEVGARGM